MEKIKFASSGELEIIPSKSSSQNDFDFYVGKWKIHNKKLKTRLNNCTEWTEFEATGEMHKILSGIGNTDNFITTFDGKPFEGLTFRLFNPKTRLWSIYWADNNVGVLDVPVVGSFENKIGIFYTKDVFNGKNIIVKFQWDATNPDKPIWSQAFSPDNGKTWEWNWYMYQERVSGRNNANELTADKNIKVIELRNYVMKEGNRDKFIEYFNEHFIASQAELGGYILGQYKPKAEDDNFFWVRGFNDMKARSKFLPEFYFGSVWKKYRGGANAMLANNDNVYLLKPLLIKDGSVDTTSGINSNVFKNEKGIMVVDYYIANHKLDNLIEFVSKKYTSVLKTAGIDNITFWISELAENDFPRLPVFQDKNLLAAISFYNDEADYQSKMKKLAATIPADLKSEMQDIVTTKNTLILYLAKK